MLAPNGCPNSRMRKPLIWEIRPLRYLMITLPPTSTLATIHGGNRRRPASRTLFHSDRGSRYASVTFRAAIGALGMVPSMSRKANRWDNAVTESFFATLKAEEIRKQYATRELAHRRIAGYIHGFYNPVRLHSALGYLSPDEYARRINLSDQPTL